MYYCKNAKCENNKQKALFRDSGVCAKCNWELAEEVAEISKEEAALIESLPYVIAYPLQKTLLEKDYFQRINLLKDTLLNYLKYLGLLVASEFFYSPLSDKNIVEMFKTKLGAKPLFGSWPAFIKECLKYLKAKDHSFFCPELPRYYEMIETGSQTEKFFGEILSVDAYGDMQVARKEATAIDRLISFRNVHLGHTTTPNEQESKKVWEEYYPILKSVLKKMKFSSEYLMLKRESNTTYLLKGTTLGIYEQDIEVDDNVWMQSPDGRIMPMVPFFIVPGEVAIGKEENVKILSYESYTPERIIFFSPEGANITTSGLILRRLNILVRKKQKEIPFIPNQFLKNVFLERLEEEKKIALTFLQEERKVIPGAYQNRREIEGKLKDWIGAKAGIFFVAAEAGSGKTNLLVEMQQQYSQIKLPSLLIRACRMEKSTLKDELYEKLNIDGSFRLGEYKRIAGSQSKPTFILVDGINESSEAQALWQEVIELSQVFPLGTLKFVVSCRANSKLEIDRFKISEKDLNILYGDAATSTDRLSSKAHWLTPLDFEELRGAWNEHIRKDRERFKPLFTFEEIAIFDRAVYDQINNPLKLRLFLETYRSMPLPGKDEKYLNVWKDWFAKLNDGEQQFLKLLADQAWESGQNEFLLDDLLINEELAAYLVSDQVDGPYNRLLLKGWVSRYTRDIDTYLSFTVEGILIFLMGSQFAERTDCSLNNLQTIIEGEPGLEQSALISYLSEEVSAKQLDIVCKLIKKGGKSLEFCTFPLVRYLNVTGIEAFLDFFKNKVKQNAWEAIYGIIERLEVLQQNKLITSLLGKIMSWNEMQVKHALLLGLKAIQVLPREQTQAYLGKVYEQLNIVEKDAEILYELGVCESELGNYRSALKFLEECLELERNTLGNEHPDVAWTMDMIGSAWIDLGYPDLAEDYYKKALDIRLIKWNSQHPDVANSYNNMGVVWDQNGNPKKALEYYQRCLDIRLKVLGDQHPYVALVLDNMGSALSGINEYSRALKSYNRALDIRTKTLGGKHPSVATSYNNIAVLWSSRGNKEKALKFYEKSLAVRLEMLGETHPYVASSYANIGFFWTEQGQYPKALDILNKCLNIQLKNLGGRHPDVAYTYCNIGNVWFYEQEFDEALILYQKALDIRLQSFGDKHPDVAQCYNNLGVAWAGKGDHKKAMEFHQKSLKIRLRAYGEQHLMVAESYINTGDAQLSLGMLDDALGMYQKCLDIRISILDNVHPDVATLYNNMGLAWRKKGDYNQALELSERSLDIRLASLGEKHPDVATSLTNIGSALRMKEEFDKALEYYGKALSICRNVHGARHSSLVPILKFMGFCFEGMSEYDKAVEHFKKACTIQCSGELLFSTARCYETQGNKEEALNNYIQSAVSYREAGELTDKETRESVKNALRIASDMGDESAIPDWFK